MIVASMLATLLFTYPTSHAFSPPKTAETVKTRAMHCGPQESSKGCRAAPLRNGPPCFLSSNPLAAAPDRKAPDMPACNRRYDMM